MSEKKAREERRQRTPAAEAAICRAHARTYELLDDPTACMEQFAPLLLAAVAPERRAEALRTLRNEAGAFDTEAVA